MYTAEEIVINVVKFFIFCAMAYLACVYTPNWVKEKYGTIYCHYDMLQGGVKVGDYDYDDYGNKDCRKSWNYDGIYYKFTDEAHIK